MINIKNGIYIELDALMDTRYGLLLKYNKTILKDMIEDTSYFTRLYDEFKYYNNNIFKLLYSNRDKSVLALSPVSKIVELIAKEYLLMESKLIEANEVPILTLTVNTYPYTLTDQEISKMNKAIKLLIINKRVEIAFINIHPKDITLNFLASTYSVVILYDFTKWLDYNIITQQGNAVDVKCYVPAKLEYPIKFKKEQDIEDMLNEISELHGGYMNITFIPVEYFCVRSQLRNILLKSIT